MSSSDKSFHQKTKRVNECDLASSLVSKSGDEEDPVIAKLTKIGCLEAHYKVQDCYFEAKDWRKCVTEVKEFQECMNRAKKQDSSK